MVVVQHKRRKRAYAFHGIALTNNGITYGPSVEMRVILT